jgi:O-glycosyl hydrolase
MKEDMKQALEGLRKAIGDDYRRAWVVQINGNPEGYIAKQSEDYEELFSFVEGKKYIKVVVDENRRRRPGYGRAWGFIVNTHDDNKFSYGDILMASSWSRPARNVARGNVLGDYMVKWTGPMYVYHYKK